LKIGVRFSRKALTPSMKSSVLPAIFWALRSAVSLPFQSVSRLSQISVYYNPTLTGASWTSVATNSATEFDTTATAFSGGRLLYTLITDAGSAGDYDFMLHEHLNRRIDTTQDVLTITATSFQGNTNVKAALTFKEIYR
jgi:hypothetical protein